MNPEDKSFVESLNCYENDYDVLRDNISKLAGMLGLQIRLLQNIQEEKEHKENVRHMTPVEQNIARLLNSFEQSISVKLAKSQDISNIKESLSSLKSEVMSLVTEDRRVVISSEKNAWSWVSKYNLKTEEHIRVGRVRLDGKGLIELWDVNLISFINRVPTTPNQYFPEWFYVMSDEHGHSYYPFEPVNEITQIFTKNKEYVTGFITDEGKVIYYDQYINSYIKEIN